MVNGSAIKLLRELKLRIADVDDLDFTPALVNDALVVIVSCHVNTVPPTAKFAREEMRNRPPIRVDRTAVGGDSQTTVKIVAEIEGTSVLCDRFVDGDSPNGDSPNIVAKAIAIRLLAAGRLAVTDCSSSPFSLKCADRRSFI